MKKLIQSEILHIAENFRQLSTLAPKIEEIAQLCTQAIRDGHKIIFCGNGGSAADSQHLAAELVGRYKLNRKAMNAMALTVDTSILTAIGNDYGFDTIFSRQLEGVGQAGDVLIGLSTSGNSPNIILAMQLAKNMGIATIALTGNAGGKMKDMADLTLNVPSDATNHIQEMHIASGHLICGIVESEIYGS
ncbi:MAG: D-sedoheptulose 7-phosphate isomerase [Akkermansia sp.]